MNRRSLNRREDGRKVDLEHPIPVGFLDVRDLTEVGERAAPRRNAGIGIDRIESTMPLGSVVDDGLQRLNVGDVHRSDIERSEEHTSELQSLMRNSYAVFCL